MYTILMTLKPISTRIPEELEGELSEVMSFEKMDKATAVRKILELGIDEWRKQYAIGLLQAGKISFNKAAEITRLSLWELAELLRQRRIEWIRYSSEEIEAEFAELSKAAQD